MMEYLATAPHDLQIFKVQALEFTGLGKDALHIYFGLGMFLLVRLLWRRRGGWILAWLAVLALALGVEWLDMRAEQAGDYLQPDKAHIHDVWNTMFWPTMLMLVGRWLQPKPKPKPKAETAVPDLSDLADQPLDQTSEQPPTV